MVKSAEQKVRIYKFIFIFRLYCQTIVYVIMYLAIDGIG